MINMIRLPLKNQLEEIMQMLKVWEKKNRFITPFCRLNRSKCARNYQKLTFKHKCQFEHENRQYLIKLRF